MLGPGPQRRRKRRVLRSTRSRSRGHAFGPRRFIAAAVTAILLLLVAPSAGADATLPVGEANGVRIERQRGAIVVVFTKRAARLYRRMAGKLVSVSCTEFVDGEGPGFSGTNSGEVTVRAPKRRRPLRTGDATRGLDYCRVWLPARTVKRGPGRARQPRRLIVSIPLTQRGAVFLDEQSKAFDLLRILLFVAIEAERRNWDGYPTAAELLEAIAESARPRRIAGQHGIVALGSPTDSPPAGAIGYYGDGQQHAAVVILSASGRRLFFEVEPDSVIHTNVAGYIYGDLE
jgi:hypothetical protein